MMTSSTVELHELRSTEYAVVLPPGVDGEVPLCLVLQGGGGSRQNLIDCQKYFDPWWAEGAMPPMILATPTAGMNYYHEWEPFLFDEFIPHLRTTYRTTATVIFGMSMGGYGALKFAFARPEMFTAVAAMQPILEPAFEEAKVGARNRIHHVAGGPKDLIGKGRDARIVEANNPANRARENAASIRESGLGVYLEVGDDDLVNAHDGVEFLHRVLWDLDIPHEYHMLRGVDHVGATVVPRMKAAYEWLGRSLTPAAPDPAIHTLRGQLKPVRDNAVETDPATVRRYGAIATASSAKA
jgi:S-formylglutathione hydrolase